MNCVSSEGQASKPVAWVTLVLGLDLSYVAAASVMASALRRRGSKAESVCMVTHDVPEAARRQLGLVFHHVVEVPYLETLALQKYSERFDAMYNYWLDRCFTKVAMFALLEYEKVIFLDADMLPMENPDALFDIPAPAGICSSVREASENARLHGMPLPRLLIDESLKNGQGHYGVRGCLLIMKPDLTTYHQIRSKIEAVTSYGSLESMVGPDEYLITKHFCDQWHHVHAKYGWVSWADRQDLGADPCFLHYVSQKPWEEGEAWADFDYWKNEAVELLKDCPNAIMYAPPLSLNALNEAHLCMSMQLFQSYN